MKRPWQTPEEVRDEYLEEMKKHYDASTTTRELMGAEAVGYLTKHKNQGGEYETRHFFLKLGHTEYILNVEYSVNEGKIDPEIAMVMDSLRGVKE